MQWQSLDLSLRLLGTVPERPASLVRVDSAQPNRVMGICSD
jgi:hypothetical protein